MSNQNNSAATAAKKINVNAVIIALLLIAIIGLLAYKFMHKSPKLTIVDNSNSSASSTTSKTPVDYKTAETVASASYEGDRSKTISFDIPESYTVVPQKVMKNTYAVMNGANKVATLYYSYEGGRGYTAAEYINNVIAPKVAGLSTLATSTIANADYATVSTANSDFRVGSYGEWLVVAESSKSASSEVVDMLKSITVK